ncbi:Transcription initiation factor TFIID subunit 7, partial [Plecturocebus cupreus]
MSKSKDDAPHELESQFILGLPSEYASTVRRAVQSGHVNLKDRLTIELHPDGRHGIVRVDRVPLASKLVDLPCVTESLKTVDKETFYKTGDISQMLVATVDGDLYPPVEEQVASTDPKASKKTDKDKEKKFICNHGITLPLKNVRKQRFQKTAKKKYIESPDVQKEVKRLLSTDAQAVSTQWEIIAEDETKETENQGLDSSSPGMSGHRQGHDSLEHDELREIFNDLSSSSEAEDETQHQDEEDINIIDTEEDLERWLQDKLNKSDEQHQKNEGTNQLVMGIQKQIDNMKGKLQETQDRAKRQEDLIMRVKNLALKNRFQSVLDELKQKEDREKEQLSSLQEELESLLEKDGVLPCQAGIGLLTSGDESTLASQSGGVTGMSHGTQPK